MSDTIISWNVPNWITICVMAFLGFAVLGLAIKAVNGVKGNADAGA